MALTRINNQALTNVTSAGIPIRSGSSLQYLQKEVQLETTFTGETDSGGTEVSSSLRHSITPSNSSNKILYQLNALIGGHDNCYAHFWLYRKIGSGSWTKLNYSTASDTDPVKSGFGAYSQSQHKPHYTSYQYLDSPNTTEEVTYTIYCAVHSSSQRMTWGRSDYYNNGQSYNAHNPTNILLTEIAG